MLDEAAVSGIHSSKEILLVASRVTAAYSSGVESVEISPSLSVHSSAMYAFPFVFERDLESFSKCTDLERSRFPPLVSSCLPRRGDRSWDDRGR